MELIINTFGTSLTRNGDGFVINGKDGSHRVPSESVSSILIGKGVQITSDAVMLAVEKEIEVLFVSKSGDPVGRVWSPKYGSVSTIRKGQLNFSYSKEAVEWIKNIIMKKIENQQALLLMMMTDGGTDSIVKKAVGRLEDYRKKIGALEGNLVSDVAPKIRGWEGISSKIYFETLNLFIPEQFRFESRSQHPAKDAVNALLNYGYGLLYGKIEGALIKVGIDPYIGVMHRDDYNRPVLVYDVIELYRIWVDFVVYSLVAQGSVTSDYYSCREDGSYWLESMGRRVLIQSINDYLDEEITVKGVVRSRATHIFLYVQSLAQEFKKFEKNRE